ncbi:MAG: amidohydrolase family protein [Bryobacteraceae bacterium]|nr:amidohydrolase family protein [Bryobacteraceae bacterium]MDW8380160.1 amidohydrolase family protein [Bryobacterales bacterium]
MPVLWSLSLSVAILAGQTAPVHGSRYNRLLIRNAMVIEGNGTPASGPRDILVEQNRIAEVGPAARRFQPDAVLEAQGKYVLPGLINMHGHTHHERGGRPMPVDYVLKLWLACGITTVRDVGSDFELTKKLREASREGSLIAPRLFVYPFFGRPRDPAAAVARVRALKEQGADGIKIVGIHRDIMEAMMAESHRLGLRVAHHIGVEETTAADCIRLKTTSIEHWYGIPDAALADGVQDFPPSYNYADEVDRFRYAGHLWRQADPERLRKVLLAMVEAGVAWDPTLNIYEASRDLQRAQTKPEFVDYLHPSLEIFFRPSRENHGSYFFGWTTADEIAWKENYRIWMRALRDFAQMGGTVTAGEDAGYIYQMYGFGYLRELELQQEAGFHPLKVIQHATLNGARVLGQAERLGRVRPGWTADLIVVNGNPLENFKILNPMGADVVVDGKLVRGGGIEWTIKDGYIYHAPTLFREVKELVHQARQQQSAPSRSSP